MSLCEYERTLPFIELAQGDGMFGQARLTGYVPVSRFALRSKIGLSLAALFVAIPFALTACGGGSSMSGSDAGQTGAATIATQPASQTVAAGQTATFSVVATGSAPLSYQWQKNG